MYLAPKYLWRTLFFCLVLQRGLPVFMIIQTGGGLAVLQGEGSSHFIFWLLN